MPRTWWQFMAMGLELLKLGQCMRCGLGKRHKQSMRSPEFTKKPEREQGGWCCVGAQRNWRKSQSPPRCRVVSGHTGCTRGHGRSSCSKSSTGLLLWAQVPKGLCLHGGDKSHRSGTQENSWSSGNHRMANSLAHASFSLKARRSEPTAILPTKQIVEGGEEIWKSDVKRIEAAHCTGDLRKVN